MAHLENQSLVSKKEQVIFYLLGIDKKWVRGENKQWVEYREEFVQEIVQEEVVKTKKWWQFWKKQ